MPVVAPFQSERYLKDMIRNYLPNIIRNKSVKNLFDFAAEEQKRILITDLINTQQFNPRLANKMYTLSNFGLQEKYLSKFTGARLIIRLQLLHGKMRVR